MSSVVVPAAQRVDMHAGPDARDRWRGFAALAADLAFETDLEGRFTLIEPPDALGYAAGALLGSPASALFFERHGGGRVSIRLDRPERRTRVHARWASGRVGSLVLSTAPLLDAAGCVVGARGVALDASEPGGPDDAAAARLRRGSVLDDIMRTMRQEVLAPRMMQAVLQTAREALGADGVAVLDLTRPGDPSFTVLHEVGSPDATAHDAALELLASGGDEPRCEALPGGPVLLACPANTRFGDRTGVAFWHGQAGRPWTEEDKLLASSVTALVRLVLEHDGIQRELALSARNDSLTGLLNRRAFLDELGRRIDRLDRENLAGTLLLLDIDGFGAINDSLGPDAGDDILAGFGAMLARLVRPADLVARFGGDEFALWLDGADHLTAAERAEALRLDVDGSLGQIAPDGRLITLSIGIACRDVGSGEFIDDVIRRADQALHEVKRGGRANWRVSRPEAVP